MKTATYTMIDGSKKSFEYDEEAPCKICDLPVVEASMGGTTICPWCDCGVYRDGVRWESMDSEKIKRKKAAWIALILINICSFYLWDLKGVAVVGLIFGIITLGTVNVGIGIS